MFKEMQLGAKAATPTVLGYLSIGLACGIVGSKAGLSPFEMGLMCLLVYSGSGQFVLCAMLLTKAPLSTIAMTVFLINIRHFLMNLHVSTIFPQAKLYQQVLIGSFMTDESYGVLLGHRLEQKVISPFWMYGNNFAGYLSWFLATVVGTILGGLIPNPDRFGIDFALVAMFVAILVNQLEGMIRRVSVKKVAWILLSVLISYFVLAIIVSESLAVLGATLLGCFVGVMIND